MKPTQQHEGDKPRRRGADNPDFDNGHRHPVGEDMFGYNRRFSSDYANYDRAHAADYQRHSDFADEYNNLREGYYQNRGTQTGNSRPSEFPDRHGNRYGRDGEYRTPAGYSNRDGGQRPYGTHSASNSGFQGGYGKEARDMADSQRGRGPKNYIRSDERIREDINDRLQDDEHIDASDIEVSVEAGDVVLTGTVDSRFAKRHAEDIAEHVSGVKNVENRVRVSNTTS